MDPTDGLVDSLNQKLHISSRRRSYTAIKVLTIRWENGDPEFQRETQEVGEMFRQQFQYEVVEYAIPTDDSQLALDHFISGSLLDLKKKHRQHGDTSLCIIHYGGHGDSDDDRRNGEERRSVWAEQASGSAIIQWHRIQDNFTTAGVDILLLLDCCFAAQAGRARGEALAKFELLAAAAMGMKTPLPGDRSFTRALINHITQEVNANGSVRIVDLHRTLTRRETNLYATPVYVALHSNQQSITLCPISTVLSPAQIGTGDQLYFQFEFCTTEPFFDSIAKWLGENAPGGVSPLKIQRIHEVFQTTTKIQQFVTQSLHSDLPLAQALEPSAVEEIMGTWESLSMLVERYNTQVKYEHEAKARAPIIAQRLNNFIRALESSNLDFSDVLERRILNSNKINDRGTLVKVMEDPMSTELGIKDQLQLRQTVENPENEVMPPMNTTRLYENFNQVLYEYRVYGPYVDPADLPDLERRVAHLAQLLSQPKGSKFLSLQCCGWAKEEIKYRFLLEFCIPDCYQLEETANQTLLSVIQEQRGLNRPTFNERLGLSLMLAKAIQSWHSVGWLHQGISGHNVFFLTLKDEARPDYSRPFLQGFHFSRPDDERSICRAADDIAAAVYWHPDRQGPGRKAHTKVHDLYSLGVVLLEIGLWQSARDIVNVGNRNKNVVTANEIRSRLQTACHSRLAHYAGTSYQQAVESCLASDFGVHSDDHNKSNLATAFHNRVVKRLANGIQL